MCSRYKNLSFVRAVVVVGFRDTSLTASERETVRFVVQKVGLFDSEIEFQLSGK